MKPQLIDLNDYVLAGEGANGFSYNHKTDSSIMLKIYFRNFEQAQRELEIAQKVYDAGISTPKPGKLISDGERLGIMFYRIENKKSFARAVGDEPEKVGIYAQEFAQMCKQLHNTHLDTSKFESVKHSYLNLLNQNPFFTEYQKQKIKDFIVNSPDSDTAVHGDLQFGNAIFTGDKRYFIDLGDFSYGYYMYDLGMVYATCKTNEEEFTLPTYHMTNQTASEFWDAFAPAYFGEKADLESIEKEVRIYAGLKTLIVERDTKRPMESFRQMLEGTIY